MDALRLETTVVRSAGPITAAVEDELVVLEPARGSYFGLNAMGRRIWELVERPRPVGDLCIALQGEFAVDEATCRAEVLAFLSAAEEAGLLVRG